MAKIDTQSIDGYENMSAEEKLAALESYEYDDNSSKLEQTKAAFDRAAKEAADWKKKHNQLLSDDERKRQENDEAFQKMQQRLEELEHEKKVNDGKTRGLAIGMDEKTAETISVSFVEGDVVKLFDAFGKFLKEHDHDFEVSLMQKTPRTPGSDGKPAMTLDEFRKLSPQDQYKFSIENPEEYKMLYGGN